MDLATLEQLRQLKYRYLRTLDLKLWDAFADTLTPDVQADYGAQLSLAGREAVVAFMSGSLGPVIITEHRMLLTGAAFYDDTYRRCEDGAWRISRTGYTRSYEAVQSLDDIPSWRLTANRWAGTRAG